MAFSLNKEDCDLAVQGAVVLGCGGGGPLPFARKIIDEITNPALVSPATSVKDDDWLAMIALVGQPSKVHDYPVPGGDGDDPVDEPDGLQFEHTRRILKFIKAVTKIESLNFFVHHGEGSRAFFDDVDGNTTSDDVIVGKPNVAARNALKHLNKQCHLRAQDPDDYPRFKSFKELNYLLTGELGAVNVAVGLYLSSALGISLADCDGAGRSVPLISQITYADRFTVSPTVMMSPLDDSALENIASVTLDLPSGTEKMAQQVAKDLLTSSEGPFAHGYIGYGTYVVNGAEARGVPVEHSYSIALEVGRVIQQRTGRERADDICSVLKKYGRDSSVVFHGEISDKSHDRIGGHDIGHVTVSGDENEMRLWYKNEIMLAGPKGEAPTYMAPDSICIVPAEGEPFDVSTITQILRREVEVFIIVIAADEKLKERKIVESFEKIYELFEDEDKDVYTGPYVPWSSSK